MTDEEKRQKEKIHALFEELDKLITRAQLIAETKHALEKAKEEED